MQSKVFQFRLRLLCPVLFLASECSAESVCGVLGHLRRSAGKMVVLEGMFDTRDLNSALVPIESCNKAPKTRNYQWATGITLDSWPSPTDDSMQGTEAKKLESLLSRSFRPYRGYRIRLTVKGVLGVKRHPVISRDNNGNVIGDGFGHSRAFIAKLTVYEILKVDAVEEVPKGQE